MAEKSYKQLKRSLEIAGTVIDRQEHELKVYRKCDKLHQEMIDTYPGIKDVWEQYVAIKRLTIKGTKFE